ncbi:conserved hypothetical protein [Deferribacter desulfuricans SSM1]|uniref:DUF5723 domain-containing protein n=1 Tax=Deferribacter desulfuricans (strain DSM 14783 / JCM 11476 / NBRC 101012 / SSM1) TaxID=639282 RepID=D3PEE2_DEFDS|nr:conjugal transfer protein TraF [Deferribacter desulfuricans]BAI80965.1 conserved hypothetical protein [Deferribacter desulfuricans SSM1]
MNNKLKFLFSIILTFLMVTFSYAAEWQIVGPRALGMGGAYVAVVNDSTAAYWNPAAFGFYSKKDIKRYEKKKFGLGIGVGAGYSVHNDLGDKIDDILDYDYDKVSNDISNGVLSAENLHDYIQIINNVNKITDKDAVVFKANGFLASRIKHFGIGIFALGNIAAVPIIDLKNIAVDSNDNNIIDSLANISGDNNYDVLSSSQANDLIAKISSLTGWDSTKAQSYVQALDDALRDNNITPTQEEIDAAYKVAEIAAEAQTGGSFDNNTSKIQFEGLIYYEIPISYGYAINNKLAIGGNVKFMKGRYYQTYVSLYDDDNDNDLFEKADEDYTESNAFGLDLGIMFKPNNLITLGIVGKNLNTPKFDKPNGGDYDLDPSARAGVAITPFSWLTLAADIDLTENDTNIRDYKSRNLGLGAEISIFKFLDLRAGMYKNLAESDIGNVYTAGLGINLYLFRLDAGISFSQDTATVDGNDYPEEVKAEVALTIDF